MGSCDFLSQKLQTRAALSFVRKPGPEKLEEAAKLDGKIAYAQRLGYLLEKAGFADLTEKLAKWVHEKNALPAKLEPSMPIRGCKKAERWKILINTDVEGDL